MWKKLKYFSTLHQNTAIKQETYIQTEPRMTTTITTMTTTTAAPAAATIGGLSRMSDDDEYEQMFAAGEGGTPRPGMDAAEVSERQDAANKAILSFSQVAKHAAAASKHRRSPKARTDYWMMNKHVIRAFDDLESQIKQNPAMMSLTDFNLLKQAIGNFRVKLVVHDSMSFHEQKKHEAETKSREKEAEKDLQEAFADKTLDPVLYLDAKETFEDLKSWAAELVKENKRIDPHNKYDRVMKGELTTNEHFGVPSQHAEISHGSGVMLRNILTPETIRRPFISLEMLTKKIRDELVMFLIGSNRHKDRHEVINQIKESCLSRRQMAAEAKKNEHK